MVPFSWRASKHGAPTCGTVDDHGRCKTCRVLILCTAVNEKWVLTLFLPPFSDGVHCLSSRLSVGEPRGRQYLPGVTFVVHENSVLCCSESAPRCLLTAYVTKASAAVQEVVARASSGLGCVAGLLEGRASPNYSCSPPALQRRGGLRRAWPLASVEQYRRWPNDVRISLCPPKRVLWDKGRDDSGVEERDSES